MRKSNIILAIIAGAAVGGAVALILKTQRALDDEEEAEGAEDAETDAQEPGEFETIAKQFSARIATELKAAEEKIKSAVNKPPDLHIPEDEHGVFL